MYTPILVSGSVNPGVVGPQIPYLPYDCFPSIAPTWYIVRLLLLSDACHNCLTASLEMSHKMNTLDNDKDLDDGSAPNVAVLEINPPTAGSPEADTLEERLSANLNHRKLNSRQVQLTSIAGSIGALLFVGIGAGLSSGPIALLIGKSCLIRLMCSSLTVRVSLLG